MKLHRTHGTVGDTQHTLRHALRRMLWTKIILLLLFVVVAFRLVQIQVIRSGEYREIARRQYEARITLPATRGAIHDRNGNAIVSNTVLVSFGADPKMIGNEARAVAAYFSDVFGKPRSYYLARLSDRQKRFVWLERGVRPQTARRIKPDRFDGLIQLNEPKRLYHYDHLAGQVIGFTDIDNNGLSGIELEYDAQLRGKNGYVIMQRDGLGRKRPSVDYPYVEPVNGSTLFLTIDLEYQAVAEEELRNGVERSKAEAGLVIMLDPATGEVLAMANYPFLNPTRASYTPQPVMKNRTITDMFEPGSMFKIVTASAAIEHHLVEAGRSFSADQGTYQITLAGGKKRTITDTHPYDRLTFREAMEYSSNIVMAKISDLVGAERLYVTARNFGFGIATGIELPGEVRGELKKPNQWSGTTLNSMAIGYEVGVTPIQIAAAYAALANNGVLLKPTIVKRMVSQGGEDVFESYPQKIRTVIDKSGARQLAEFLTGAVDRGTGKGARIEGFPIAGKTGTARKFNEGQYQTGSYTASFAGFFPADDPKVVCLVMLDNPREGGYTGGLASAPIFRAIAAKVKATSDRFRKAATPLIVGKPPASVPDVTNLTLESAETILEEQGFTVEASGKGALVLRQRPAAGTSVARGATVTVETDATTRASREGYAVVPDITGLSMRRAINRLTMLQLSIQVRGSGIVAEQSPRPGKEIKKGEVVSLRCAPTAPAPVKVL
ncbi:MAG: penicillin-binding transpeptidase domain-containing protein [Ignavibacteria bacterium]|nr:penicillin-binding transpeptidase domain-containing protein [Ignavibacteria bacterium]